MQTQTFMTDYDLNVLLSSDEKTYFDYSVEDVVIVVAIPAVDAEVLHSFGAPKKNRVKNCLYLLNCNTDF